MDIQAQKTVDFGSRQIPLFVSLKGIIDQRNKLRIRAVAPFQNTFFEQGFGRFGCFVEHYSVGKAADNFIFAVKTIERQIAFFAAEFGLIFFGDNLLQLGNVLHRLNFAIFQYVLAFFEAVNNDFDRLVAQLVLRFDHGLGN